MLYLSDRRRGDGRFEMSGQLVSGLFGVGWRIPWIDPMETGGNDLRIAESVRQPRKASQEHRLNDGNSKELMAGG